LSRIPKPGFNASTQELRTMAPSRILLIRHGESEDNAHPEYKHQLPDPFLTTPEGEDQASAWQGVIEDYEADLVLISPLKRTVQTASLVFGQSEDLPRELLRCAREVNWTTPENDIVSTHADMSHLLARLPFGNEVTKVNAALEEDPSVKDEKESVAKLLKVLASRQEETVAVVCHGGTIAYATNFTFGEDTPPRNCELFDCSFGSDGYLQVAERIQSPFFSSGVNEDAVTGPRRPDTKTCSACCIS